MAKCSQCGKHAGAFSGLCTECGTAHADVVAERSIAAAENYRERQRINQERYEQVARLAQHVVCVTTPDVPGARIAGTLGIITAECAFGMNLFRDFFAGMSDVFGGRSASTQQVLRDARERCLGELQYAAAERGANAVVGVDLDYSEFSGGGKSMLFLVASGTAVITYPADADGARLGQSGNFAAIAEPA